MERHADHPCPVTKVAELLSDAWTMRIMHALVSKRKRFCELERELEGISTRTLTLKLKRLEREGMIKKTLHWYESTERGKGLRIVITAMRKYDARYLQK